MTMFFAVLCRALPYTSSALIEIMPTKLIPVPEFTFNSRITGQRMNATSQEWFRSVQRAWTWPMGWWTTGGLGITRAPMKAISATVCRTWALNSPGSSTVDEQLCRRESVVRIVPGAEKSGY
jgi:hypothetical protein